MKILHIAHAFPPHNTAGVEVYTHTLCRQLAHNHRVYVFHRISQPEQKEYTLRHIEKEGIGIFSINNTFRYCYSFVDLYANEKITEDLIKVIDEMSPDVVHVQHIAFLSATVIKKIKQRNIPVVLTLHDYWYMCPKWHGLRNNLQPCTKFGRSQFDSECLSCISELLHLKRDSKIIYAFLKKILPLNILTRCKAAYFSAVGLRKNDISINKLYERASEMKHLLNMVDILLAPSEFVRNKYIEFGIPPEKINLLRFGIAGSLANDKQIKNKHRLCFGFIGTVLPAKGVDVLIEAFNDIRNPNVELRIYGDLRPYLGFERYPGYLKKIVRNKNILFMGGFDHQKIASVFHEIDVLVVPSLWEENSPLVIQEAFASGTPVIGSRIGGIPELVTDGVSGLLFTPGDSQGLREKLEYLTDNPEIIQKFKENMPKAKNIQEHAREIEEIYAHLIGKNK
ncbi:MAG: glycosyltransferase family 4 protein [Candidatus Omnitrophica bacterium]|nr:glycosyltransferase family 4 protein [Candidatus Omnitrophota bacterium]